MNSSLNGRISEYANICRLQDLKFTCLNYQVTTVFPWFRYEVDAYQPNQTKGYQLV